MFVVVWSATTINFFLPRISGQNPVRQRILKQISGGVGSFGMGAATEEFIKKYDRLFGLDKPLWQQYLNYLGQIARLDFGESIAVYPTPVSRIISSALPWTIGLLGISTLLSVLIGSLFGALVAWKSSVRWLQFIAAPIMALSAIPYYLMGIILTSTFAYGLKWFPGSGGYDFTATPEWSWEFAFDVMSHLVLPALSVILSASGFWALGMRGNMVMLEGEDFMFFAEAKGLKAKTIFFNYALRNALLPQVTSLALALGYVLSGSVLVEVVFGLPGIGTVLYEAIKGVDFPVLQGVIFTIILALSLSIMILDLTLPFLDPRITYKKV